MGIAELRRLRQPEYENRKLKKIIADQTPDNIILHNVTRAEVPTGRIYQIIGKHNNVDLYYKNVLKMGAGSMVI